jgi:hypothetical protein
MMAADVLTYHNDNMRTGENLNETILTPANVNASSFGKVAQLPVDGQIYAQPLYKSNVFIPGKGVHNVVYVATEHDSVYAFDANNGTLLWKDSFINPAAGVTTVSPTDVGADNISPEVGITGTPVIDVATHAIYVVDKIKITAGSTTQFAQRLHALDLSTGAEQGGGPVTIRATVPGVGVGSVNGRISFNPLTQLQRSGLLLVNGVVYIAWASHGDVLPYQGWVIGYNARTLKQTAVFNAAPNGEAAGIWMSGGAPAADSNGNIFLSTGNGTFDANAGGKDYGDSVLKLSPQKKLAVTDYFTPSNQAFLQSQDLDLGSGGVLLLPDQPGARRHLLVTAGKQQSVVYVINRDSMGHFSSQNNRVAQILPTALFSSFGTPAYFQGTIYYVGSPGIVPNGPDQQDVLKAFRIFNGQLAPPTLGQFTYGYPGSTPSISAHGSANGIVWTLDNSGGFSSNPAIVRAYAASNVAHELYDSTQAGTRDQAGVGVTFAVPTVANGHVYVGGSGALTIYGLLAHP